MEDVCDLSHLLQGEHHEKEKLELAIQDIDSTLEIESRRLDQENENCDVMIKRKAELQLRVNHVCESMEISMARLEQSSKEIEKCDTIIIIPKIEEYLKRKDEILQNIDDFRSRIALIEAELTDTLLLEYSNLADSVAQLREAYSCSSIELDALTKQSLLLTESMEAMDNQIKLQKDEVLSRKQLIASLDSELEEKKKKIANSCETLRLFHADVQEANIKAEGEFKHAQQVHEEAKCEVQRLTEAICIETGKLVNASDCHNIIANKRLHVLQKLSDLKHEEDSLLKQIKDDESTIQTEQAETAMLVTSLSVTTSSIAAQKKMIDINDNQVMCNVIDFDVDDEVSQLQSDLVTTENMLQLLLTQLESNSNAELVDVIARVAEATEKQKSNCEDLIEARACVTELDNALEKKRDAETALAHRLEQVLSDIDTQASRNRDRSASLVNLKAEKSQLLLNDQAVRDDTELRNKIATDQGVVHDKENVLAGMKHQHIKIFEEQKARRESLRQEAISIEGNNRCD